MTDENQEKKDLAAVGEPDKLEIVPGLILEDKIRIKTQRRLEKHFDLPIARIFPGEVEDPTTKKMVKWNGVDFNFLDNAIPLITILARQVDDTVTEAYVENIIDNIEDQGKLAENLTKLFTKLVSEKNLKRPNQQSPQK